MRSGWFKPVHAKSDPSNRMKLLLAHRRTLKRKLMDVENEIRQSLKMFGLMVGRRVQRASFETRVTALVADDPLLGSTTACRFAASDQPAGKERIPRRRRPPARDGALRRPPPRNDVTTG